MKINEIVFTQNILHTTVLCTPLCRKRISTNDKCLLIWQKKEMKSDLCSIFNARSQKYSRIRCLLRVKGLFFLFYLGWSLPVFYIQIRTNIIKVGSKSWLLTCSSNITLSLPSYTVFTLYRGLN